MTTVSVQFDWQEAGDIRYDGKPAFPTLPAVPGLYRFTFHRHTGPPRVYIGETSDLRRRAGNYRNPGATQLTNVRLNNELVTALRSGMRISCAVVTDATISLDGASARELDLSRKTGRVIVENAAMAAAIAARDADAEGGPILVNRPGVGEAEWA